MSEIKRLKDVELKLIAELMKNSRRTDRELARVIGVSQPTISRTVKRLEKEGYIKEYTMIPDFSKLGYEIMGITGLQIQKEPTKEELGEIRKMSIETEKSAPQAALMAVNGTDHDKNRLFITFYEDFAALSKAMELTKRIPFADVRSVDSFLVNLKDETNYRILSMSEIAQHILKKVKRSQKGVKP